MRLFHVLLLAQKCLSLQLWILSIISLGVSFSYHHVLPSGLWAHTYFNPLKMNDIQILVPGDSVTNNYHFSHFTALKDTRKIFLVKGGWRGIFKKGEIHNSPNQQSCIQRDEMYLAMILSSNAWSVSSRKIHWRHNKGNKSRKKWRMMFKPHIKASTKKRENKNLRGSELKSIYWGGQIVGWFIGNAPETSELPQQHRGVAEQARYLPLLLFSVRVWYLLQSRDWSCCQNQQSLDWKEGKSLHSKPGSENSLERELDQKRWIITAF